MLLQALPCRLAARPGSAGRRSPPTSSGATSGAALPAPGGGGGCAWSKNEGSEPSCGEGLTCLQTRLQILNRSRASKPLLVGGVPAEGTGRAEQEGGERLTEVLIPLQAFGKKQADGETDKMIEKWEVICSRAAGLVLPSITGRGGGGIERSRRVTPACRGRVGSAVGGTVPTRPPQPRQLWPRTSGSRHACFPGENKEQHL